MGLGVVFRVVFRVAVLTVVVTPVGPSVVEVGPVLLHPRLRLRPVLRPPTQKALIHQGIAIVTGSPSPTSGPTFGWTNKAHELSLL